MKVSVIMPTLNRGAIIGQAIDSVLSQTYHDLELLVVDGLSTDNTVEILRGYGDKIRFVREKDRNTSDAMNKGLTKITGDLVTFLNSDDYFADQFVVEKAVAEFKAQPATDILCADLGMTAEGSDKILFRNPSRPGKMVWGLTIHLPGSFFRRRLFARRSFDLSITTANDYDLILYFLKVEHAKVLYVPRIHVIFRLGGMCNDVNRAFVVARECYRIRKVYYGRAVAAFFYFFAYTVSVMRTSGFRPQLWLRQARAWLQV